MPTRQYKTVPDELVDCVAVIAQHFENLGFNIRIEHYEVGFPYTPVLLCKRGKITTLIVELDSRIRFERLQNWARYGRSCGRDTQVALCLPSSVNVSGDDLAQFQQEGIGLYSVHPDRLVEHRPHVDLALPLALPELGTFPARIRQLLGPAYEQFAHAHWREGFERACQSFEDEARRYLKRWSRTGRIKILRKSGPVSLSNREIERMTMGGLAEAFSKIQAQNYSDSVIAHALSKIKKDRNAVTHFKGRIRTERRLRTNVGQYMWIILAALKEML